jgi:hypothetical protein
MLRPVLTVLSRLSICAFVILEPPAAPYLRTKLVGVQEASAQATLCSRALQNSPNSNALMVNSPLFCTLLGILSSAQAEAVPFT